MSAKERIQHVEEENLDRQQFECETIINQTKRKIRRSSWWVWVFVIIGVANLVFAFIMTHLELPTWGSWLSNVGDYASGTTGASLAFAAVIQVYIAYLGQLQQIQITKIELIENRRQAIQANREFEGQKIELQEQNKHLLAQRVENTYFLLYENFQKMREDIGDHISKGEIGLAFRIACNNLHNAIIGKGNIKYSDEDVRNIDFVASKVSSHLRQNVRVKGYCATFNFMVKILWENRSVGLGLFDHLYSSCTSHYEFAILFYFNTDNEKIKKILRETGFLEYVDKSLLTNPEHLNFYKS